MTEPRRKRRQKQLELQKIPPHELRMAKYVRWHTPKKTTTIQKEEVDYFVGSKAIDTLLESKYGKKCKKENPRFQSRQDCLNFMKIMIDNQMFYRAEKVLKEEKPKDESKKKSSEKDRKKEETLAAAAAAGDNGKKTEEKKKRRKYILNCHEQQKMIDGADIYVWRFDPVQPKNTLLGLLIMLGVIMATLFPLWPTSLRIAVYYLSIVCACFVGAVLLTGLLRSIFFAIVWLVTMGKYHVWFLPNLLADVGFFDSFKPVYTIEYHEPASGKEKKSSEACEEEARTKEEKSKGDERSGEGKQEEEEQEVAPSNTTLPNDSAEEWNDIGDDDDVVEDDDEEEEEGGDSSEFEMITDDKSAVGDKKND